METFLENKELYIKTKGKNTKIMFTIIEISMIQFI